MTVIFNILLLPFGSLHPLWGLMWISALAGILMILVFKWTSNQQAISELRRKMGSRALGMLLYLESPPTVLKLALGLITDNFIYLWHLLKPMLVIAVPFILIAAQLDARYGKLPPSSDHPSTLIMRWEDSIPSGEFVPDRGEIISPVVTVADSLEQSFSFTGENGVFAIDHLGILAGSEGNSGSVVVRGAEKSGITRTFFRPWNTPVNSEIKSIQVSLESTSFNILGGRWSWFAVFIVFSSLWASLGAVVFKVKV